jgi:hypothetical protein
MEKPPGLILIAPIPKICVKPRAGIQGLREREGRPFQFARLTAESASPLFASFVFPKPSGVAPRGKEGGVQGRHPSRAGITLPFESALLPPLNSP